jgi:hypothetical protein
MVFSIETTRLGTFVCANTRSHGQQRTSLNNMLNEKRPVSASPVKALGLQKVYVPQQDNR